MTEFSIAVEIAAPPERVWAVLADLERWPEWTASVTSVELARARSARRGDPGRVSQPKLKPAVWEVTRGEGWARLHLGHSPSRPSRHRPPPAGADREGHPRHPRRPLLRSTRPPRRLVHPNPQPPLSGVRGGWVEEAQYAIRAGRAGKAYAETRNTRRTWNTRGV
jgi:hypothetical protein